MARYVTTLLGTAILAAATLSASAVVSPSPETIVYATPQDISQNDQAEVLATYAKLSHATKMGALHEAAHDPAHKDANAASRIDTEALVFQLSNFTVGTLESISKRPYSDFVDRPTDKIFL